ncbi:hypothetical protein [Asaia platycodi]|uniref:hypothetical protein n=1 Tax=Asaia platycodi TaxID=610243 RepID=UPI000AED76A1|nr:hypothetical protein [Asaia platycodi]
MDQSLVYAAHTGHGDGASSQSPASRPKLDRIFNDPDGVVEDGVRGALLAHPDIIVETANPRVVKRAKTTGRRKVGVITGGGSGHELLSLDMSARACWILWRSVRSFPRRRQ